MVEVSPPLLVSFFIMAMLQVQGLHSMLVPNSDCSPSMALADTLLENCTISPDGLSSVSARDIGRAGDGLLIIIPDMVFNCYGSVSSWTGIFSADANSLQHLAQEEVRVHLQVWRPISNGTYDLVGSDPLHFNSTTIGEELPTAEMEMDTYYHQFTVPSGGLTFQPGDVVGCFIPATIDKSSLGLAFRNASGPISASGSAGSKGVELLVYPVEGDICDATVAVCEGSQVIVSSVRPQLCAHQESGNIQFGFSGDFGSGSGQHQVSCSSNTVPTTCATTTTACQGCSPGEGVSGLFIVIAAVCIAVVCAIGLTANLVTFSIARRNSEQTRHDRVQLRTTNRIEANCPFVINHEMEDSDQLQVAERTDQGTTEHSVPLNQRSLEEFFELQYGGMETEGNADSHRMSWV